MDSAGFVAFGRSISRGWTFLVHAKGWKLGVLGVATSLLSLQLLLVTLAGARMAESAALERGVVHLDVEPGTLDQRVQELYAHLRSLPSVLEATYVTGEQILIEEQARDPSLAEFLEQYGMENPFPDAFVAVPRDGSTYAELRRFVEAEDDRGGIGPTAFAEIAQKEASTRELLSVVQTVVTGLGLLAILAAATSALLSFNLLVHLAAARATSVHAELLAGATPVITSTPAVTAGAVALISSLIVATLAAGIIGIVLAFLPASSAIGGWFSHAAWTSILPSIPAIIGLEGAGLLALAHLVGRAGSAFRP